MPWTAPKTWATNDLVTAADLNTHVRDNLDVLKSPPSVFSRPNVSASTTTTSFLDMPGWSASITTTGGPLMMMAYVYITGTGPGVDLDIDIDGTSYMTATGWAGYGWATVAGSSGAVGAHIMVVYPVAAGAHTVKLKWKYLSGTVSGSRGAFWVREV